MYCLGSFWRLGGRTLEDGAVYSQAAVTIAAEVGDDNEGGCFNVQIQQDGARREDRNNTIENASVLWSGAKTSQLICLHSPLEASDLRRRSIKTNPLIQRDWALKERIFSPVFHYTDSQLYWECLVE